MKYVEQMIEIRPHPSGDHAALVECIEACYGCAQAQAQAQACAEACRLCGDDSESHARQRVWSVAVCARRRAAAASWRAVASRRGRPRRRRTET